MAKKKNSLASLSVEFDTKDIADGLSKISANMAKFGVAATKSFGPISKSGAKAFGDLAKSGEKSLGHLSKFSGKAFGDIAKHGEKSFGHLSKSAASSLGSITKMISSVNKEWVGLGKSMMGGGGSGLMGGLVQGLGIGAGLGALKGLTGAITAPFTNIGQAILDSSDIEIVDRKFKSVFGNMTKDAEKFARTFAGKVGQSESGIKSTMSRFQDTLVPMGFGRKQATDISKSMTSLSTDLAASEGITQTEAADRIVSGMVGNHEALRRFGVVITETTLNSKLLAMGIKGGSKAATEQEKAIARLNLVIAGTRDAQGTAARAGGSFATEMGSLNAMLKQVSGTIGNAFKPAATEILKFFREGLSNISGNLSGATEWGVALGKAAKHVLDSLKEVRTWVETTIGTIGSYFGKIANALAFATSSTEAFRKTFGELKTLVANAFEFGLTEIQSEGLKVVGAISGGIMGAIGVATEKIKSAMKDTAMMIARIMDMITDKLAAVEKAARYAAAFTTGGIGGLAGEAVGNMATPSSGPSISAQDAMANAFKEKTAEELAAEAKRNADKSRSGILAGAMAGYQGASEGIDASGVSEAQKRRLAAMNAAMGNLSSSQPPPNAASTATTDDKKLKQIKPEKSFFSKLGQSLYNSATGIAGKLIGPDGIDDGLDGSAPERDKDGKLKQKTTTRAWLSAVGESAYANIGYEKPRAKVQFGDVQSTYKSIQSALGGKDDKKEALRMKILEKQKELAEKQLAAIEKAPAELGRVIKEYLGLT